MTIIITDLSSSDITTIDSKIDKEALEIIAPEYPGSVWVRDWRTRTDGAVITDDDIESGELGFDVERISVEQALEICAEGHAVFIREESQGCWWASRIEHG